MKVQVYKSKYVSSLYFVIDHDTDIGVIINQYGFWKESIDRMYADTGNRIETNMLDILVVTGHTKGEILTLLQS